MSAERHAHYDHYATTQIGRLDGFYGRVESEIAKRMIPWLKGPRVLDIGCGFGSLVEQFRLLGFEAVGIDQLGEFIDTGRLRYPNADLRSVPHDGSLPFDDKSVDTVVLKEVIHHVFDEDDLTAFLGDVMRICRSRVIVVDPNPTLFLRLARTILRHVDPVCAPSEAEQALQAAGMHIVHREFHEVIALPLSGGYISHQFIKGRVAGDMVLSMDKALLRLSRLVALDRHIAWRYLLVADLAPTAAN